MPLGSYVDTVYYFTTFAWRSLTTGTFFPLVFRVEKSLPICWYTLPIHAISQTKRVCEIEHQSVCVLTRTYITCTSTNYVDTPELPTPLEAGDAATRNAAVFFSGTVLVITTRYLVLVMRALATSISMYVRTYRNSINKCTTMKPPAVPWGSFYRTYCLFSDKI